MTAPQVFLQSESKAAGRTSFWVAKEPGSGVGRWLNWVLNWDLGLGHYYVSGISLFFLLHSHHMPLSSLVRILSWSISSLPGYKWCYVQALFLAPPLNGCLFFYRCLVIVFYEINNIAYFSECGFCLKGNINCLSGYVSEMSSLNSTSTCTERAAKILLGIELQAFDN